MHIRQYVWATVIMVAAYQQSRSQDYYRLREEMVSQQLEPRGIKHGPTLEAMRRVERQRFVPAACHDEAYIDGPLPIGCGQTRSPPLIVALVTLLPRPHPRVRLPQRCTGPDDRAPA